MKIQKKQLPVYAYDRVVRTTCPSCGAGCGLKIFLNEGKAVGVYGDEDNQLNKGSLCPRGLSALYHLYHEKRLLKPLLRESLDKQFREVRWDEAADYVADKLKLIGERFSPESVYLHLTPHSGFGNVILGKVFGNLFGTHNVNESLSAESSPAGMVLKHMLGLDANGCAMSSRHEWSACRVMLLVGIDPAVTDPVAFGPIIDARDRGCRVIALDSRNSISMSMANIPLKCRLGTEKAVLLALANVIIEEKLYNQDFVNWWVDGFEDFAVLCRNHPPAEVERISGVKKEDIIKAARVFSGDFPSQVLGLSRVGSRYSSAGLVFGMASLAAVTGSIGCPGGGLSLLDNFPPLKADKGDTKESFSGNPGLTKAGSGSAVWRAIVEGRPYPIKGIIWDGNALSLAPRGSKVRDALNKMDLIVNLGQYPNLTYHHSHVVFPIASFLETDGLVFSSVGRVLQWANRAFEPRGERRAADDFWGGLLQRMGFASGFSFIDEHGRVNIREMTKHFLSISPMTSAVTPELLDPENNEHGGVQWPAPNENDADFESHKASVRGCEGLFRPGSRFPGSEKRFPTPSGRIMISPKGISAQEGFQEFTGDHGPTGTGSFPASPLKGKNFYLTTGELVDYLPSAGFWAMPQKPEKALYVQIHPKRAKEIGVRHGDMVVVENSFGKIEAPAWISDRVNEETVLCPVGADPYDPLFPYESPCGLMDFVPENEKNGRLNLEAALVKVRKIS